MFSIKKPHGFNLKNTLSILQRGDSDPINHIKDGKLCRTLNGDDTKCIVEIMDHEKHLSVNIVHGAMPKKTIRDKLIRLLGFDDPLLLDETDIPFKQSSLPNYETLFESIVQTILGQLISATAANHIRCRFITAFGDYTLYDKQKFYTFPHPLKISQTPADEISALGIGKTKAVAIIKAAEHCLDVNWRSALLDPQTSNQDCTLQLTSIHGIGTWTSDWVCLRALRRYDIVPSGDLVIRKALSKYWGEQNILSQKQIMQREDSLGPLKGLVAYRLMLQFISGAQPPKTVKRRTASTQQKTTSHKKKKLSLTRMQWSILLAIGKTRGHPLGEVAHMVQMKIYDVKPLIDIMLDQNILRCERHLGKLYFFCESFDTTISQLSTTERKSILSTLLPPPRNKTDKQTQYARRCFGHMAGTAGVLLAKGLFKKGYLNDSGKPTSAGLDTFSQLGLDIKQLPVKLCLDWTEREHHIGGKLGKAMTDLFISKGWIKTAESNRSVTITQEGKEKFSILFGVNLD